MAFEAIRAHKLRYYEDRNFAGRVLPAPGLSADGYADRPAASADDWSGRTAAPAPHPVVDADLGEDGSGGLQQERHPGLPARRRVQRPAPEQLDLLGLGDDDSNPVVDAGAIDQLRPLAPVLAAHAVNEGSGRGGDLLPRF